MTIFHYLSSITLFIKFDHVQSQAHSLPIYKHRLNINRFLCIELHQKIFGYENKNICFHTKKVKT